MSNSFINLGLTDANASGASGSDASASGSTSGGGCCGGGGCMCGASSSTSSSESSKSSDASSTVTATTTGAATQDFLITGMTCGHCVSSVTEELSDLDSVAAVDVDLNVGGASRVRVSASVPLDVEKVRAAVSEAGYELVDASA